MIEEWTDKDETLLRELITQDLSASQIAARLTFPLSRNAVIGKIRRLGLRLNRAQSEQRKPKQFKKKKPPATRSRQSAPELPPPHVPYVPREPAPVLPPTEDCQPSQCCWPVNDGRPWLYCGNPSQPGRRRNGRRRDYCEAHERLRVNGG